MPDRKVALVQVDFQEDQVNQAFKVLQVPQDGLDRQDSQVKTVPMGCQGLQDHQVYQVLEVLQELPVFREEMVVQDFLVLLDLQDRLGLEVSLVDQVHLAGQDPGEPLGHPVCPVHKVFRAARDY